MMDQRDPLTKRIIGAAIEVHRILGPGLLDSIYEEAPGVELALRDMQFQRQLSIDVQYKGHTIRGQRLDSVVENQVVVELKAVVKLPDVALAQVIFYPKATGLERGLLLNFACSRLADGVQRVSL